ncbi:MAG: putative phage holin [Rhodococcus sp. (in: high G+C Gram-positive bacteria)]
MDRHAAAGLGWQMTLREVGDWALFTLAVVVNAFTLLYLFGSSDGWRHNRVGRVYLAKSVVLSVVLIQISLSVIYKSDYWNRDTVRLIVYSAGIAAYLWMMKSLLREQREDRADN